MTAEALHITGEALGWIASELLGKDAKVISAHWDYMTDHLVLVFDEPKREAACRVTKTISRYDLISRQPYEWEEF